MEYGVQSEGLDGDENENENTHVSFDRKKAFTEKEIQDLLEDLQRCRRRGDAGMRIY